MVVVIPERADAAPERASDTIASLLRALELELELLRSLRAQLVQQRAALAADDTASLELVIQEIGRTLLTLGEARRQRGLLTEVVVGRPGVSLGEVADLIPADTQARFRATCRRLREGAIVANRELGVNQSAIRRAIEAGERFLQILLTAPEVAQGGGTASGLLLNHRA